MAAQAVVVGAGVGGLAAAINLRIHGCDVTVLEAAEGVGGKARGIELGGFRLDPGPSIVILPQIYEALFRAAGRDMGDYLRFRRLDPISRVYFEGEAPIDLPASLEGCVEIVRQRSLADASALESLIRLHDDLRPHIEASIFRHPFEKPWQLLDPHLAAAGTRFDLRATYKELVDRRFHTPMLRAFFYGFPSYGGQSYDAKAPGAFMIPYLMIRDGVYYPDGGVAAIPTALERLATELGVKIEVNRRVVGVEWDGKTVHSARTADGGELRADVFVSNVDRTTFGELLGRKATIRPSYSYFTAHWGIKTKIEGLGHHTLLVPVGFERSFEQLYRNREFPDDPIVYLNAPHVEDPACAPPGATNLFAVVTSPAVEGGIDWDGRQAELASRVRRTLERFGLGFDDADVAFERIQTPAYFKREHGNYRGSLYGGDEASRLFGLFPQSNADDTYRNLFYCGGSVQPGAGLPMVVLSGRFAADKAKAYLNRR